MSTIRQLAQEKLNTVINNPGMNPGQAAELAQELSVLLGSIGEHVAELEFKANSVMQLALETDKDLPVARAELAMKASKEYVDFKKAKALLSAVEQTIISLRRRVSAEEKEWNLTQ